MLLRSIVLTIINVKNTRGILNRNSKVAEMQELTDMI